MTLQRGSIYSAEEVIASIILSHGDNLKDDINKDRRFILQAFGMNAKKNMQVYRNDSTNDVYVGEINARSERSGFGRIIF